MASPEDSAQIDEQAHLSAAPKAVRLRPAHSCTPVHLHVVLSNDAVQTAGRAQEWLRSSLNVGNAPALPVPCRLSSLHIVAALCEAEAAGWKGEAAVEAQREFEESVYWDAKNVETGIDVVSAALFLRADGAFRYAARHCVAAYFQGSSTTVLRAMLSTRCDLMAEEVKAAMVEPWDAMPTKLREPPSRLPNAWLDLQAVEACLQHADLATLCTFKGVDSHWRDAARRVLCSAEWQQRQDGSEGRALLSTQIAMRGKRIERHFERLAAQEK